MPFIWGLHLFSIFYKLQCNLHTKRKDGNIDTEKHMVAIFPPLYQAGGIFANLRWACKCHTDFLQAAWSTHVFKHKMFNSTLVTYKQPNTQHCPKNNLTLRIKTEPVTVGANATVYIWFLCQINTLFVYVFKSGESVQTVTCLVFKIYNTVGTVYRLGR